MASVEVISQRHCPQKSWGWEEWIVNNDLYCGKRLHFTKLSSAGGHTSLHFHMKKHETMYAELGSFVITTIDPVTAVRAQNYLAKGSSLVIPPGLVHRIECGDFELGGVEAVLLEFSTHHEDIDSYRVER